MTTQLTIRDIVRAALDEFAGAGGVSDRDIDVFLEKLGVEAAIVDIVRRIAAELVVQIADDEAVSIRRNGAEVKRRLLAGQSVGEAYKEGGK